MRNCTVFARTSSPSLVELFRMHHTFLLVHILLLVLLRVDRNVGIKLYYLDVS